MGATGEWELSVLELHILTSFCVYKIRIGRM